VVKKKNLVVLLASISLVLVLVLTGCGQTTTTPSTPSAPSTPSSPQVVTKTVEVEKTYKAMNPTGVFIPVETKGLAPRLDTLDGKTIYVQQGEADPVIMPALAQALPAKYPKTTWVYYKPTSSFVVSAPDATTKAEAKATICGIGW
jgi:hypothetical protein